MGTKVQLKSYLPEFCAMRDLNEDADSSWSQFHGDRATGRHHFGHAQQTGRSNIYLGCDRESMKQTILAQNATFRNQVYELHRLYNRQKELMDELKKKGPYGYLQADTSLSNSYSSQIPPDGTNKMRHMPHLASTSTSYNKVPVTMNGDKVPSLNFLKESCTQSGLVLTGKGATPEDGGIMDSTSNRHPRRMFDLQLPAEVYIDCADAEKSEKEIVADSSSANMFPLNSIRAAPKKDVKPALGTSESFNYREDSLKSDLCTQNGVAHGLADLNEPIIKDNLFERAAGSVSYNLLGQRSTREENQGHQLLTRPNTSFPGVQSAFFRGRHTEEGTYPNLLHADKKETSQEWPFFNNEAGQTTSIRTLFGPGSSKENFSISSEETQLKFKKPLEILSSNQNQKDMWYKNKQAHGFEISGGYPPCEQSAPLMPNSFSALPNRDYTSTISPLLSSWTKPSNDYIGVLAGQSLPCFGGAVAQNQSCTSHKWQRNGDLQSHPILGAQPSSHQNGFTNVSFQQHYNSASQLYLQPITFGKPNLDSRVDNDNESRRAQVTSKDVNSSQVDLSVIQICRTAQSNPVISDSKGKHDSSSGIPSWLRRKPNGISSHIELDFSNGYPKLKPSCSTVYPGPEKTPEMEKSRHLLNLQDLPSTSQLQESGVAKTESSDGLSSKKIFGFTIFDETKQNPALSAPHQQPPVTSSNKCSDKDQIPPGGPVTEISCTGFRSRINLNSDPDEEEAVVVPPLVPSSTVVSEINLEAEAPATSEAEKPDAALVKEAAESILLMLSNERSRLENIPCHPQPHASFDTLNWFAELVSSEENSVKGSSHDGLDLFEQMTLELEETKPEEFLCRPGKGEDQKDDDGDDDRKDIAATLLFPKPRRGQGRRRRQRRDFQTDILPGLASLSRLEVTEDIQTISGLMKASGQPWQSGSTRRNTGRSRGRRPRSLAVAVAEIPASPPPPPPPPPVSAEAQPTNRTEIEADGGNIVGWGRTTRRCRRQRCPPVTNIAASVTLRHLL